MLRCGNNKWRKKKRLRTAAFDCKTGLSERTSGEETSFLMRYIRPLGQLTRVEGGAEDGGMSTTAEFTAPRRSARVFRKMKIQAQGRGHNGKKFREVCETLVVITNPETQEEMECRIVYLGDLCDQGQRVAIEFLTPAPHFWGLEFSDQAVPRRDPPVVH